MSNTSYNVSFTEDQWRKIQMYLMAVKRIKNDTATKWTQHAFDTKVDQLLENQRLAKDDIKSIESLLITLANVKVR